MNLRNVREGDDGKVTRNAFSDYHFELVREFMVASKIARQTI